MESKPIILFDGVCNLCNSSVQRVIKNERKTSFQFASLQSGFAQSLLLSKAYDPNQIDSILLYHKGKLYKKSRAIFRIAARLKLPYPLLYIFWPIPYFLRDLVYDWVARNRYKWFGKLEECWVPTADLSDRFIEK